MDPISILVGLALMVVSYLIMPSNVQQQKPAALEEFEFPQSDEGTPQSRLFGQAWRPDWFVLWFGQYKTKKIKSEGKK